MNRAKADALIRDTEVVRSGLERILLDSLDGIVHASVDALDDGAELELSPKLGLIAVRSDDVEALALLLGGVEGTDASSASSSVDDIRAIVILRERKLLAHGRILKVIGVGDGDFDIRIDAARAGDIADLVAHDRRNANATDEADLTRLAGQCGERTGEERALLLPEDVGHDVVRLNDCVDDGELAIRILTRDFGHRIGKQKANADGEIARLGGIRQVADVVGGGLRLEHVEGDAQLVGCTGSTLVGHVIEALVADAGGVGHHRCGDGVLSADIDRAEERRSESRSTCCEHKATTVNAAGEQRAVGHEIVCSCVVCRAAPSGADRIKQWVPAWDDEIVSGTVDRLRDMTGRHSPIHQGTVNFMAPQDLHASHLNLPRMADALRSNTSDPTADFSLTSRLTLVHAAHVAALGRDGVLDTGVQDAIWRALDTARLDAPAHDIHPWDVMAHVDDRINGQLPAELSGATSLGLTRVEAIATALRMGWRASLAEVADSSIGFRESLLKLVQAHTVTVMVATWDRRAASPTTLAHFLTGAVGQNVVATDRILSALDAVDRSPYGSGALAGEVMNLDREEISAALGFRTSIASTFDALSSIEDFVQAVESVAATGAATRRLIDELLTIIRTEPTSFFLDERWERVPEPSMPAHTASDRLEQLSMDLRRVEGTARSAVDLLRSLPYGPLGVAWNGIAPAIDDVLRRGIDAMRDATSAIDEALIVNRAYLANRAGRGYSTAGDLAPFLMEHEGLAPTVARQIAGLVVSALKEQNLEASQVTPDHIDSAALTVIGQELKVEMETLGRYLAPRRFIERRDVLGSPAPDRMRSYLADAATIAETDRAAIRERTTRWKTAERALIGLLEPS